MSLVTWANTNSRALGKLGLYGIGGVLVGYPAVKFGAAMYHGSSVESSVDQACYEGIGYTPSSGAFSQAKARNGIIRTGLGALAILAARKI